MSLLPSSASCLEQALHECGVRHLLLKFHKFGVQLLNEVTDLLLSDLEEIGLNRRQVRQLQKLATARVLVPDDPNATNASGGSPRAMPLPSPSKQGKSKETEEADQHLPATGSSQDDETACSSLGDAPSADATVAVQLWPDNVKRFKGKTAYWLEHMPAGWRQGSKTTAGGLQRTCWVSPDQKIYYHKQDVEKAIGKKLPAALSGKGKAVATMRGMVPVKEKVMNSAMLCVKSVKKAKGAGTGKLTSRQSDTEAEDDVKAAAMELLRVDSNQKGGGGAEAYRSSVEQLLVTIKILRNQFLRADLRRLVECMNTKKQLKTPGSFKVCIPFILKGLRVRKADIEAVYRDYPNTQPLMAQKTKDVRKCYYAIRAVATNNCKKHRNAAAKKKHTRDSHLSEAGPDRKRAKSESSPVNCMTSVSKSSSSSASAVESL